MGQGGLVDEDLRLDVGAGLDDEDGRTQRRDHHRRERERQDLALDTQREHCPLRLGQGFRRR